MVFILHGKFSRIAGLVHGVCLVLLLGLSSYQLIELLRIELQGCFDGEIDCVLLVFL